MEVTLSKAGEYFFNQGILGVGMVCLCIALWFLYKELRDEKKARLIDSKEAAKSLTEIANASTQFIKENTIHLQEIRREHSDESKKREETDRRFIEFMDMAIRRVAETK